MALLDTGASNSGIVQGIADQLGLAPAGKRPMYIARGQMQVERYLFRIGLQPSDDGGEPSFPFIFEATLEFELSDTAALPDGRRLDAVIGMDVLSDCDFSMDRRGWCTLEFGYSVHR